MGIVLSVIIPVYNEARYIMACLESVVANNFADMEYEILVVDGGSSDPTVAMVAAFAAEHPEVSLLHNPDKTVPFALNLGIGAARGEYIARIDAHAQYPADYFKTLVEWHEKLGDADNVGCACRTDVLRKTPFSNAIKTVMSDRFGVGGSLFRTGSPVLKEVDTVPFGCYKRAVFEKYGMFDTRLTRNQDIELNKRIVNGGGKIYLIPDITCTYFARDSIGAFAGNRYLTGQWIVKTAWLTRSFRSLSGRHFVPLLFVLSLLFSVFGGLADDCLFYPGGVALLLYFGLMGTRSLVLSHKVPDTAWYHLLGAFTLLHISYGIGSIAGLLTVLRWLIWK